MSADDFTTALVTNGQAWMVLSLSAVVPILWAFTLIMHFGRPYTLRFLGTLTLRFGGDVWWLSYVLIRDGLMVVTFSLSVLFLMPNLYIGLGLPLTAPLATVVLFWALVVKFLRDADDDPRAFQAVSLLLVFASVLYIVPQIYGLEAADQVEALDKLAGLGGIPAALVANSDAGLNALAWPIEWLSIGLFFLTGGALFVRYLVRLGREPAGAQEQPAA